MTLLEVTNVYLFSIGQYLDASKMVYPYRQLLEHRSRCLGLQFPPPVTRKE
jgi:hypothetical protein